MLLTYKSAYYTSSHYHLGDLINVIQQVHHRALSHPGLHFMFSKHCPCCGIDSGKMVQELLSLLDTPVKYGKSKNFILMSPAWTKQHKATPYDWKYAKAKNLPKQGEHVVYQFDKRSKGNKVPANVFDFVKPDMINIGERSKLDLLEKFHILASAKSYIGIDSGISHLALMTETPILVIHPKSWNASRYYPQSNQLRFLEI